MSVSAVRCRTGLISALTVSFGLLVPGCDVPGTELGCPAGTIEISNGCEMTGDGPHGTTGGSPALQISPRAIDFGPAEVSSQVLLEIEIYNPSSSPRSVLVSNPDNPAFTVDVVPSIELAAGGRRSIPVAFRPARTGEALGEVLVDGCGGGCPMKVELRGAGYEAGGGTTCADLDLGRVRIGQCRYAQMSCFNAEASEVVVRGAVASPARTKIRARAEAGQRVAPGSRFSVNLEFCPEDPGVAVAQVNVELEAADGASAFVTGVGQQEAGCALDFAEVDHRGVLLDERHVFDVRISNGGSETCRFDFLGLAPGGSPEIRVGQTWQDADLPPGRALSTPVEFGADMPGLFRAELVFDVGEPPTRQRVPFIVETGAPGTDLVVTSRSAGALPPFEGGEALPTGQNRWDGDDGLVDLPLDFSFVFFGHPVDKIWLSANGTIRFGGSFRPDFINTELPASERPNQMIAWWWDDLFPEGAGPDAVRFRRVRGPGGAELHIRFESIPHFSDRAGSRVSAEIRLYAGANRVEVQYGEIAGGDLFTASIGWEGADGQSGADLLGCSPNCTGSSWPRNTIYTFRDER